MSDRLRAYRFATPEQWQTGVLHRFEPGAGRGLTPARRFGSLPERVTEGGPVELVAVGPHSAVYFRRRTRRQGVRLQRIDEGRTSAPFEMDSVLAKSRRWIVGEQWLWAFDGSLLRRYDLERLQPDWSVPIGHDIADIAAAPHDGVFALLGERARGTASHEHGGRVRLLHIDCRGTLSEVRLPRGVRHAVQLASTERGKRLCVLSEAGSRLVVLDAPSAADGDASDGTRRELSISQLLPVERASWLASDAARGVALSGTGSSPSGALAQARYIGAGASGFSSRGGLAPPSGVLARNGKGAPEAWALSVLDSDGDRIDQPLLDPPGPLPASFARHPNAIAVGAGVLWFATDDGLWRLDTTDASVAREAESTFLTPALHSPEGGTDRGWSRAEIDIDLSRGAVLEVHAACTRRPSEREPNPPTVEQVQRVARDTSLSSDERQARIWAMLDEPKSVRVSVAEPNRAGVPISVPLFELTPPWLWLRIRLVLPPESPIVPIRELRVLYPNVSIVEQLPAIFRGEQHDPTGFLRRFVGVLEATTQSLDERIRAIGRTLDPATAPPDWLDFLARWLDLPWDDGLPVDAKRRTLADARSIMSLRGTRSGLLALLRALVGPDGSVRVSDLTADSAPARLGGNGRAGPGLPLMLAGPSPRVALLDGQARLNRTCLSRSPRDCDPLEHLIPTVRVVIDAPRESRRLLETLLPDVVAQFVPLEVRVTIRWRAAEPGLSMLGPIDDRRLDAEGPGALDDDSVLGRTRLVGRRTRGIEEADFDGGYRLH
jgi:phage tail-like protein